MVGAESISREEVARAGEVLSDSLEQIDEGVTFSVAEPGGGGGCKFFPDLVDARNECASLAGRANDDRPLVAHVSFPREVLTLLETVEASCDRRRFDTHLLGETGHRDARRLLR